MGKIAVIGASNIDITAKSTARMVPGDSNPGEVLSSPGGVGRNLASALRLLGCEVLFATAIADDEGGRSLAKELGRSGVRLLLPPFSNESCRTGVYCCVIDADGCVACAVNDMLINGRLAPETVTPLRETLEGCDYVVIDANIPKETIEAVASMNVRIAGDCVSTIKAPRFEGVLSRLHLLKANIDEARILAGTGGNLDEIVQGLRKKGLESAIISLGEDGAAFFGEDTVLLRLPVPDGFNPVSFNGCGDVLLAAFLKSRSDGRNAEESLRYALLAAALNSESHEAVSPVLSHEKITERI